MTRGKRGSRTGEEPRPGVAPCSALCLAGLHAGGLLAPMGKTPISSGHCCQWGRARLQGWGEAGEGCLAHCSRHRERRELSPVHVADIPGKMSAWQPRSFSIHCHHVTSGQEVDLIFRIATSRFSTGSFGQGKGKESSYPVLYHFVVSSHYIIRHVRAPLSSGLRALPSTGPCGTLEAALFPLCHLV